MKKRLKRQQQKARKKFCAQTESSECSTLGSPDWPPPDHSVFDSEKESIPTDDLHISESLTSIPIVDAEQEPLSEKEIDLFGLDGTVVCYKQDEENGFQMADGSYLEGDELIDFLLKNNRKLAEKAQFYHRKYCDAGAEITSRNVEATQKMERIRQFYQNMLYGSSRSALMVQRAIAENV